MTKFEKLHRQLYNIKYDFQLHATNLHTVLLPEAALVPAALPTAMERQLAYKALVWKLTKSQDLSNVPNIHLRKWREYDLDHIISIYDGFKKGLPAAAIASIDNLRIIPHKQNAEKRTRSDYKANPLAGLLVALK